MLCAMLFHTYTIEETPRFLMMRRVVGGPWDHTCDVTRKQLAGDPAIKFEKFRIPRYTMGIPLSACGIPFSARGIPFVRPWDPAGNVRE